MPPPQAKDRTVSPAGWVEVNAKYDIRCDHAVTVHIPEEDALPYATLDSFLVVSNSYYKGTVRYKSNKPIIKTESMSVLRFKDGADYLALYSQDMSMLSSLSTRHIVAAMPLPLKERSKFKKEVDVFYMGEPELAAKLQSVSAEPIENIPDLEGFLRSFEPFNDMGITSLTDIKLRRRLNATDNLKKCREAADRRCN